MKRLFVLLLVFLMPLQVLASALPTVSDAGQDETRQAVMYLWQAELVQDQADDSFPDNLEDTLAHFYGDEPCMLCLHVWAPQTWSAKVGRNVVSLLPSPYLPMVGRPPKA